MACSSIHSIASNATSSGGRVWPAAEHGEEMRRGQPAIELPHLHVVEVLGAGGRKDGERHRGPRLAVREARARGDHSGDERVGKSDPGRHARAAGHAGQVDAPGIDGEPAADVGGHGLRRLRRDGVRAVPRVVRRGDDVTVLLGGGPELLDHQRASGRRMKGENHAPLPLRGIGGRQVQGVGLRGIVGAHHALERNATLRCLRRRGARAQHQRHEQERLQKAHGRTRRAGLYAGAAGTKPHETLENGGSATNG